MTSNQIAYATQQETHRHNVVEEDIAQRANDINEMRNQMENQYRTELNAIQKEYNAKSLELQQAQGDRKLDLQQELNWIQFKLANVEENYKASIADINAKNSDIAAKTQLETERYQKKLNELGYTKNEIEAQLASIKAKQAEYEKYSIENQVRIQDFNALVNKAKVENDYSLGLINAELQETRNEIEQQRLEMQEFKTAVDNATSITHSIWEGASTILGFRRK